MTPRGTLTTLYSFCSRSGCADGALPQAALLQASNGDFYGTTSLGGNNGCGTDGCGTIFKITSGGKLTTLYSFCTLPNCADGSFPTGALMQATDGYLYGTTAENGVNNGGTVFKIDLTGNLTTLYSFCSQPNCADGEGPDGVIQVTSGDLYGTTAAGGLYSDGTIFSLNVGLAPFVALQTTVGDFGASVTILGTDLTGATSVTFNGTPATFIVNSNASAITAAVPPGATTGTVQVITPRGTLNSNVVYTVR